MLEHRWPVGNMTICKESTIRAPHAHMRQASYSLLPNLGEQDSKGKGKERLQRTCRL